MQKVDDGLVEYALASARMLKTVLRKPAAAVLDAFYRVATKAQLREYNDSRTEDAHD